MCCAAKNQAISAPETIRRVRCLPRDVSPQSLLRHMQKVYVVTSQYGFEALMAGKPGCVVSSRGTQAGG
jgi:capsular polysaccharide export protein